MRRYGCTGALKKFPGQGEFRYRIAPAVLLLLRHTPNPTTRVAINSVNVPGSGTGATESWAAGSKISVPPAPTVKLDPSARGWSEARINVPSSTERSPSNEFSPLRISSPAPYLLQNACARKRTGESHRVTVGVEDGVSAGIEDERQVGRKERPGLERSSAEGERSRAALGAHTGGNQETTVEGHTIRCRHFRFR